MSSCYLPHSALGGIVVNDVEMATPIIENWMTHLYAEGKSNRTVKDRRIVLRRFERDIGTPVLIASTAQCAQWLGRDELSPVTRSVYHSILSAFYRWAISVGLREDNPCAPIKAAKRPRRQPRPVSLEQYRRLISAAEDDHQLTAMLLLAGMQGLRVHEVARFHSRHLDMEARTLEVVGKGGASYVLPAAQQIIEHAENMPMTGFWFPSQRAKHLGGRAVSEKIRIHMIRQKVPGTPHCLRHFFGTQLVSNGADLRVAQELLRHSSLQTTAIYVATSDDRKREAIDRLVA
ncbi:tyrosine integrase [Gordonia phage Gudmit]|nr:tyrosine integrase [Gordonia phage Gudmit]